MRGTDERTGALFSSLSPESLANAALQRLTPQFSQLCSPGGRASIAPEKLLRALL